jgi:IclR family acetate operon transcriptional repressor
VSTVKEIQSVRNACVILEAIAARQPIGVSELARVTGIDKSAAHRVTVTLHGAGWLHRTGDGRWQVAAALRQMVDRAASDTLVSVFRPVIERLRDETGETTMLVAIEGSRLLVLDVADSRHNLRITAPVGSTLPLPSSSAARAIAAHLPPDDLAALRGLDPSLDDRTLADARQRGWAINDREIVPDARVVGAPVLSEVGYPVAAVIVCAPTSRVDLEHMTRIGTLVARATRDIALSSTADA